MAGENNIPYAPIFIGERYNQIWPKREGYKKFGVFNSDWRIEAEVSVTLKLYVYFYL